ncbi:uncharacterized protein LOC105440922 [Strongylocentrotus purpuratus]|uniref:HTH CENPB-type domain-containing protein n=1 Tax=Strongylocentrotus purpuratus TaxID=7668 RepID=A0A7M7NE32_STRPU|nr:uncharacterized protein LOC105440922 [Strongylocentrotus purpuratus]
MPKFKNWKQEDVNNALRRVDLGELSIREAATEYGVPKSTLHDKLSHKSPFVSKQGPKPYLTRAEEEVICTWAIQMARIGMGQTKDDIKNVVKQTLDKDGRPNPFPNNKPGDTWFSGFLKRNPRLSLRTPQAIGKERAIVTAGTINIWFDEFESYLKEVNATSILTEPNRMFNCDESGFALGGEAGKRVLAEKGSKVVHVVKSSDKSQVTVLATVSATGTFPPPLIVLPGIRAEYHYGHMVGAPKGAFFGRTESGWMDSKTFLGFVTNLFHPFLVRNKIPLPVLLLVDGHSTH